MLNLKRLIVIPFFYIRAAMGKFLFLLLIIILPGRAIGFFADAFPAIPIQVKQLTGNNVIQARLFLPDPVKEKGSRPGDNKEILDLPSGPDACFQRYCIVLKSNVTAEDPALSYVEFDIHHLPWTLKEINTPPPKS